MVTLVVTSIYASARISLLSLMRLRAEAAQMAQQH
jgi:hypothetical protein